MAYNGMRTASDTLGTTYLAAGSYPVNLVYYHDSGSAELEFYAAYEETSSAGVTSFDANSILVGDTSATTAAGGVSTIHSPGGHQRAHRGTFAAGQRHPDERLLDRESGHRRGGHHVALFADLLQRHRSHAGFVDEPDLADAVRLGLCRLFERSGDRQQQRAGLADVELGRPWSIATAPCRPRPTRTSISPPYLALISPQAVSSITSSGTTATVTLPNNGFFNGETITIAGASQSSIQRKLRHRQRYREHVHLYDQRHRPLHRPREPSRLARRRDVLAVQTLMATPTDAGPLRVARHHREHRHRPGWPALLSSEPTPGTYNTPGSWQPDLTFSVQHGFFSASFPLTLVDDDAGRKHLLHDRQFDARPARRSPASRTAAQRPR